MEYTILYNKQVVKNDIPKLSKKDKGAIKKAIEQKLTTRPELYGKPLRTSLAGFRKLRVINHRIIFKITRNEVTIVFIRHRKNVYETAKKRLG